MTRAKRKIYFYIFLFVFFAAAPAVILYSQGYVFHFADFSLKKTGAIFVSTSPKGVRIFINNKLAATTSNIIFSQGKLLSHLAPGEYAVKIEKDEFTSWDKKLAVEPQLVAEARNIFLAPRNARAEIIEEKVSDVILSDSHAVIAYVKTDGAAILDVSSPKIVPLTAAPGEKVGKARFGKNEGYLIIESFLKNKVKKYLRNVPLGTIAEIQESDSDPFIKIRHSPAGEQKIIALSSSHTLYMIDVRSQNEKIILADHISNFEIFGEKILYATEAPSIVYEKDMVSGKTEQLNQTPIEHIDFSSKILRSRGGFIAIINSARALFLYNDEKRELQRIAGDIADAVFSDDDKKLAWRNRNEMHVYYLKDILLQPKKTQGTVELITRFSKPISAMAWFAYDNEHILFTADGKLKLIELDGRDKRNIYDITDIKRPAKIIYNTFDDFIYFLDGETFKKITLIKI